MTTDAVDAVVDYRAESRAGKHVLDVAVRSEGGGVLHVELTVSDRIGEVVGEGDLRLPPETLPPAERLLGQVLRGLAALHTVPRQAAPPHCEPRSRPRTPRSWSDAEHDRLRAEWDGGGSVQAIAAAHGRSPNAIQSRLLKLGLISLDHPESPVHQNAARP